MNILFVLYGGAETNSFIPLSLFAKELIKRGHDCTVVLHDKQEKRKIIEGVAFFHPQDALKNPSSCFKNKKPADLLHAWTPRQNVTQFLLAYQALFPRPLVIYLEDHEGWIAEQFVCSLGKQVCKETEMSLGKLIPGALSHPYNYRYLLGLADAVATIVPALKEEVPAWIPAKTIMLGVDLDFFTPRLPKQDIRKKLAIGDNERVIVYCGGINRFTAPAIKSLCQTIELLHQRGYPCRLVRSGIEKLSTFPGICRKDLKHVIELGVLPRLELPDLMASADIFIQPGEPSPFEKFRLPCKITEFMAMGIPSIIPNGNIASLVKQEKEALVHTTGRVEEMADLCEKVFKDTFLQSQLRVGARQFAENYFKITQKVDQLEGLYKIAITRFNEYQAELFWKSANQETSLLKLLIKKMEHLLTYAETDEKNNCHKREQLLAEYLLLLEQRLCQRDQQVDEFQMRKRTKFLNYVTSYIRRNFYN